MDRSTERLDVITLGEALIDFVSTGRAPLEASEKFLRAAGGAPANVAVGLARLGVRCGFLGKVGADPFGRYLAGILRDNGVDTSALRSTAQAKTAVAFVSLGKAGEREFLFYRDRSADLLLAPEDINEEYLARAKVLHFGSLCLVGSPSREATLKALASARGLGTIISCDPNLRLDLWPAEDTCRQTVLSAIRFADLVKLSAEEARFLSGLDRIEPAADFLAEAGPRTVIITLGPRGCYYLWTNFRGNVPGYKVRVLDTTGAGDGFMAGLLASALSVIRNGGSIHEMDREEIIGCMRYANAVGALTTTVRGAIPALPTVAQVRSFLGSHGVPD